MSKKIIILITVLSVIALVAVFFPSDKKRIRKVVENGRQAVRSENLEDFMALISLNYHDDFGGNYINLKKQMENLFKQFENFDITIEIMDITVHDGDAIAELNINMIASQDERRGYIIGDAEQGQDIHVYLEKAPYKWKVARFEGVIESERMIDGVHIQ